MRLLDVSGRLESHAIGCIILRVSRGNSKEFFMPFCGAMFDENSVPPLDKGGLQGGFEHGDQATPAQRATPPKEGFFRRDTELTAEFEV
jgi:hypothetical protein